MASMIERSPCVYILATGHNGTLYVGVTSNLLARIVQHREGSFGGHTKRNAIHRLVYFEMAETTEAAIVREKVLKRWRRDWKRNLIERETRHGMILRWGSVCLLWRHRQAARWTPEQVRGDEVNYPPAFALR